MATITAIEPQKRDPNRVNVHLDGKYAFDIAGILAVWLKVGQEIDDKKIAALQADDVREGAYQLALAFLSYRARSEAEIRQHLRKHKISDDVVQQTVARLRTNRLADDKQFARLWVENRTSFRPRSGRALAWELHKKGVPADTTQAALQDLDEPGLAYQAGLKRAAHLGSSDQAEFHRKLTAFLARRGFAYAVINPVVSRLWNETHSGQHTTDDKEIS